MRSRACHFVAEGHTTTSLKARELEPSENITPLVASSTRTHTRDATESIDGTVQCIRPAKMGWHTRAEASDERKAMVSCIVDVYTNVMGSHRPAERSSNGPSRRSKGSKGGAG
ncbi:hypothetical protein H257_04204 [Aphanomyces astaci]|uniref:Uncharacterized protein n=1 Tax=Aphanomyces astaci TaxID=112090 RepID=W4GX39_APHAT|nr:hypothetical protein H257_04204 [Aphanomyces astaci]ETV83483.1 hypothetical protein H257_04204 [Aphanomyces astaci]|eukprot:XP_009826913.1 hypothetical protein H257_04204 [Aphanomyces astaci]